MLEIDRKRMEELRRRRDRAAVAASLGGPAVDPEAAAGLLAWCGSLHAVRDLSKSGDVPDDVLRVCASLARVQAA